MKVHQYAEQMLYSGKQVAGPIFVLKNNYGWQDTQTVEHTGTADTLKLIFEGFSRPKALEQETIEVEADPVE